MTEFLNDPVAVSMVIIAVLINVAALGLKYQSGSSKVAHAPAEGKTCN